MVCARARDAGRRSELRIPGIAAQTRMVSLARIRRVSRKSPRIFKRIICDDVSEFESHMPSHAVGSLWRVYPVCVFALFRRGCGVRTNNAAVPTCGIAVMANRSRLCARQHGRDHRVPVGRVRDRMVHRSTAPAPPRTARRRVTYRAAILRWPAARITLRQGARVVHDSGHRRKAAAAITTTRPWVVGALDLTVSNVVHPPSIHRQHLRSNPT
jgi:hypothetical protein